MSTGPRPDAVVTDHSVHVFYFSETLTEDARFAGDEHLLMADLARPSAAPHPWLLTPWVDALSSRYGFRPLWQVATRSGLSRDLLPPVRSLLSGEDRRRLTRYGLSEQASGPLRQLLAGGGLAEGEEGGRRDRFTLSLDLSSSAMRRLSRHRDMPVDRRLKVRIGTPAVLALRWGVAMLDLPVAFETHDRRPLSSDVLAEAVKAVARTNTMRWVGPERDAGESFSLGCIARALLEGPYGRCDPDRRAATCTYVQLEESASDDDVKVVALSIATHQTADYAVETPRADDDGRVMADVAKVAAPEGSCIAVRRRSDVEFLREYRTTAFEGAYLPLVQLSLLEQSALLKLMGDGARWPALQEAPTRELADIGRIRTRAMQYRLAYSFPRVSLLAAHDDWHQSLERQLRLPALRAGLDADMAAVHGAAHEAHLRGLAWLEALGGGFIALATAFSVLKDVLASSFSRTVDGQIVPGSLRLGMGVEIATAPLLAAGASALVGTVVAVVLFRRARS